MADVSIGTALESQELPLLACHPSEQEQQPRFWGNARPPNERELSWIKSFGEYDKFQPNGVRLSSRVSLQIADLKQATQIIVFYHYLHRGRTMAQLPYWILMDEKKIGVLLFAYPRLSVPLRGIKPMNLLELARMWLHPSVQGGSLNDSDGNAHSVSVASCALGKALRRTRSDWHAKYPNLPDIEAVVSWADTVHHEGTVYKAANFKDMGQSGGSMHGNRSRSNGGKDQMNPDYRNIKTLFMYPFERRLTEHQKRQAIREKERPCPIQLDLI